MTAARRLRTTLAAITAIAAMLLASRTELGDPNAGQTTENLDSITAVVIGGTSLFGGRGSIAGAFVGSVLMGVIRNGLILSGLSASQQRVVTGLIIVVAVAISQRQSRD